MNEETAVDIDTLTVVQQVLKGAFLAIAASANADLVKCASLMHVYGSSGPNLDPRARAMLKDIAEGIDGVGHARRSRPTGEST